MKGENIGKSIDVSDLILQYNVTMPVFTGCGRLKEARLHPPLVAIYFGMPSSFSK